MGGRVRKGAAFALALVAVLVPLRGGLLAMQDRQARVREHRRAAQQQEVRARGAQRKAARLAHNERGASGAALQALDTSAVVPTRDESNGRETDADRPRAAEGEGEGEDANEAEEIKGREDWFYNQRAFPNTTIPVGALQHAHAQAKVLDAARPTKTAATATKAAAAAQSPINLQWTSIGPRPISQSSDSIFYNGDPPWSGRVTAIAPHPTDTNTAYLGAANGGVWKTTDGGANWTPIFDGQTSLAIGTIAVSRTNPNLIFVGTGEANGTSINSHIYYGNGIYRSTNGGSTWTKVGGTTFDNCFVSRIQVKPNDANVVVASVSARGFSPAGNPNPCTNSRSGIYRSADGGSTWSQRLFGAPASDVNFSVSAPSTVYAGFYTFGVYKSTDGGVTWAQLGGGLPTVSTDGADRTVVAVAPNNANRVYALIAAQGNDLYGFFTSSDAGVTWSQLNASSSFCNLGSGGQCWYDLTLAVDPSNANVTYVGGINLYRYDIGPANEFHRIGFNGSRATIHVDMHATSFANTNARLWVGSDGGAYRTSDGGSTFTDLNATLAITQFYPGVSGRSGGPLVAGTQDNGSLKFTGAANTWNEINAGDGGYAAVDPNNNNIVYTSYVNLTLYRSTNGGTTNSRIDGGMCTALNGTGPQDPCEFIAPFVMDPSLSTRLYAGTDRVWRSTNSGGLWTAISPHFPNTIQTIGVAPSNSSVLFASTTGGALYVTTNGGGAWNNVVANGLPNRIITDIIVNPANSAEVYVTDSGFGTGHLWRSRNDGGMWTNLSGNLPNAPANAFIANWTDSPNTLYVGTDVGVFRSTDDGTTWTGSTGLPSVPVMDLLLDNQRDTDPSNDRLIAVTHGRGAFRAPK